MTNTELLTAALEGFRNQRNALDANIKQAENLLATGREVPIEQSRHRSKRHVISAAVRARMAAAQRQRWAKAKAAPITEVPAPRRKWKLSKAAHEHIIAAQRGRWAAYRAAQKKVERKQP